MLRTKFKEHWERKKISMLYSQISILVWLMANGFSEDRKSICPYFGPREEGV